MFNAEVAMSSRITGRRLPEKFGVRLWRYAARPRTAQETRKRRAWRMMRGVVYVYLLRVAAIADKVAVRLRTSCVGDE